MRRRLAGGAVALSLALAASDDAAVRVIVIDPGHGGGQDSGSQAERSLSSSNNATSPAKLLEKDLTLELSLELVRQIDALAKDHPETTLRPVLTRDKDVNPNFIERAAVCAKAKPAAIFSIHFNASDNHAALGTVAVVWNKPSNPNFAVDDAFARGLIAAAHGGVVKFLPKSPALTPISDSHLHGGSGSNFFFQLAKYPELKAVPKCFLEIEFIDRKETDEALLKKRKEAFPVIAKAIAEYLYARAR